MPLLSRQGNGTAEAKGKKNRQKKQKPTVEQVVKEINTDANKDTISEAEFVAYAVKHHKKWDESKAKAAFPEMGGSADKAHDQLNLVKATLWLTAR